MKNLKTNRHKFIYAALTALTFLFALQIRIAAQTGLQFNALYNCPKSSMYNFKVLECANEQNCQVAFYTGYEPNLTFSYKADVYKSRITDALNAGGCTINGKPLEAIKTDAPQNDVEKADNQPTRENGKTNAGRFKVGDRVLASPAALKEEKYFEKCTVIKDMMAAEGYDSYRVLCDDPKGGIGRESYVKVPFIKAWANAEPPPATPECPFNEPPGTVSKTSKPTSETFKRVIYDWKKATADGRQIGITFQIFELGKPFVNRLTNNGLLHDGAPQGATIYPIKTKYLFCDKYTDSTIRWLVESQFACFKDKFGEWVCPVDSVPNYIEQIYLPNK